ncbi:MAG: 2-dehydropantoate 2-reductase [Actinomycetes bacterium]
MSSEVEVDTNLTFAVIGAGAVGGYYGAMLARAGHEVHFLARNHAPDMNRNGIEVLSPHGDFTVAPVHAHPTWDTVPTCDVVIVAVKATANDDVFARVSTVVKSNGVVLLIQNGIGSELHLTAHLPDSVEIVGGLAFIGAEKTGSNQVSHSNYGALTLGVFAADYGQAQSDTRFIDLTDALTNSGVITHVSDNLLAARWQKLIWNIPFSALSVILDATTAELIGHPATYRLAQTMMDEVMVAAAADGCPLPADLPDGMLAATRSMKPYSTSMKVDFNAGRSLEYEAIAGGALARARATNTPMPTLEAIYRQLAFIDSQIRGL